MNVEGKSGAGGAAAPPPVDMPAGLSYEAVLYTLKRRLSDLNGQIESVRETIESRSQRANDLADRIQELKDLKTKMNEGDSDEIHASELTPEQRKQLAEAGIEIPEDVPTHEEYTEALASSVPEITGYAPGSATREATATMDGYMEGFVSAEEIDNAISKLNTDLQQVNSDNETLMIQLQESISQRQTQIQLATNSMKSISDGEKGIVRNIGA